MARVKGGYTTRQRRKKVLKLAKGYVGSKRTLYRTANEQVMRSLRYSYRDRKQRKREFRKDSKEGRIDGNKGRRRRNGKRGIGA